MDYSWNQFIYLIKTIFISVQFDLQFILSTLSQIVTVHQPFDSHNQQTGHEALTKLLLESFIVFKIEKVFFFPKKPLWIQDEKDSQIDSIIIHAKGNILKVTISDKSLTCDKRLVPKFLVQQSLLKWDSVFLSVHQEPTLNKLWFHVFYFFFYPHRCTSSSSQKELAIIQSSRMLSLTVRLLPRKKVLAW